MKTPTDFDLAIGVVNAAITSVSNDIRIHGSDETYMCILGVLTDVRKSLINMSIALETGA